MLIDDQLEASGQKPLPPQPSSSSNEVPQYAPPTYDDALREPGPRDLPSPSTRDGKRPIPTQSRESGDFPPPPEHPQRSTSMSGKRAMPGGMPGNYQPAPLMAPSSSAASTSGSSNSPYPGSTTTLDAVANFLGPVLDGVAAHFEAKHQRHQMRREARWERRNERHAERWGLGGAVLGPRGSYGAYGPPAQGYAGPAMGYGPQAGYPSVPQVYPQQPPPPQPQQQQQLPYLPPLGPPPQGRGTVEGSSRSGDPRVPEPWRMVGSNSGREKDRSL